MPWSFQEAHSSQWREGPPEQSSVPRLLCVCRWVGRHITCLGSRLAVPGLWGWCCHLRRNGCHRWSHGQGIYFGSSLAWPSSVPMWIGRERADTPPTTTWTQSWGGHSNYHHMNSIMGRTLHLPSHELNHGENTPPTITWTQSWGWHLPPHELNHGEYTPPTTTWTQSRGGHSTYHHINSIMGRTLHLPPHELNHGEDTPPTTTQTQSWGGHSTCHHMNSIMGRTLHLPPHELNHGEGTLLTITWTQSWGAHST